MRRIATRAIALVLHAAVLAVHPTIARAQGAAQGDTAAAPTQRARDLFEAANESLRTGRFAEAVGLLRSSLQLAPRPGTGFNLAVALRGTGDALGAAAVLERLYGGEYGPMEADKREEVASLRAEVAAEIGTVRVVVRGAERIDVRVDGEKAGTTGDGGTLSARVNPGRHRVIATARDRETAERAVEVPRGGSVSVELRLAVRAGSRLTLRCSDPSATITVGGVGSAKGRFERDLPAGDYLVVVRTDDGERSTRVRLSAGRPVSMNLDPPSRPILERPWFWIGAGALAVAGGVAVAIVATQTRTEDPASDPYWGVTAASFR